MYSIFRGEISRNIARIFAEIFVRILATFEARVFARILADLSHTPLSNVDSVKSNISLAVSSVRYIMF
jgi:hypothetical protein